MYATTTANELLTSPVGGRSTQQRRGPQPAASTRKPRRGSARAEQLQAFLTELRTHADPLLVPTRPGRRRSPGLTQAQVASHLGLTTTYYGRLELGKATWKQEWLDALSELYSLDRHQQRMLYRLAVGWEPERKPEQEAPGTHELTRALIDPLPYPALLIDPLYTIVQANRHAAALFPELEVGANAVKRTLCDPRMRRRLYDWKRSWATPIIAGLRLAALRLPEQYHAQIDALIAELLRDEQVGALWKETRGLSQAAPPERIVWTDDGPVAVRLSTQNPAGYPYGKLMFAVPVDRRNSPAPGRQRADQLYLTTPAHETG